MQEGTETSSGHLRETTRVRAEDGWTGDVYARNCPTRLLLDRIADKWTVLLLTTLAETTPGGGPMRFNALKRRVEGVSQKMLSQTLRQMERDGLVSRTVRTAVPIEVTYALTPLGGTLVAALQPMVDWAQTQMPVVAHAQAAFDRRPQPG